MLEFDDPMGSVSAVFRPFQVGGEGKKRKKRYGIDKKSESSAVCDYRKRIWSEIC